MTSPGSRATLKTQLSSLLRAIFTLILVLGIGAALAAPEFLPPEQAFRFGIRATDARTAEISFDIADGYYLYHDQFRFTAERDVRLGKTEIPGGKVKFDETFQKEVATHRGRLVMRLPVEEASASFVVTVRSQGCADAGLCYPPMESRAALSLAGFGGDGSARVADGGDVPAVKPLADRASAEPSQAGGSGTRGKTDGEGVEGVLRTGRLWLVVGVFFVAGLLLSLTPCVLPMLPILSSIIVGSNAQHASRSRGFLLALIYSLGMALVYTAMGVAAGLAGEGLAAWLQTPWVLGGFALMLAVFAFSMFGLYELQLPARWRDAMSVTTHRLRGGHVASVFAMGGVSALIVSPCVAAPLAGALIYLSQTRDVVLGGSALFSLAAGMSLPLLIVGGSAGALLPAAGPWMEGIKRSFGVLLLGVAWWTLSPVLPAALGVAGWGLLLLLAASLLRAFDRLGDEHGIAHRLRQAVGLALAVAGTAQLIGAAAGGRDPLRPLQPFQAVNAASAAESINSGNPVRATSPQASAQGAGFQRVASLEELDDRIRRSAGRPVMLDFYADWCVSCKEMERLTFGEPAVSERMGKALLLQVDVTKNTEADRVLLKRFGLFGPPGIIFFDPAGREIADVRVIGFQDAERFGRSLAAAGL